MLALNNVTKRFGTHLVYRIDNLVLPGGVYWIKGANGSGKSTFLKMLAGLIPFEGDIQLLQTSIRKEPVLYRQKINHAPADPVYPSFLRGIELVDFVKAIKKGTATQVANLKAQLGIDHYLQNPTGSYSSGMLKKLSLLLAFIGHPHWILLDEPYTTLDQAAQAALTHLIEQKRAEGTSFILTSHHAIGLTGLSFTDTYLMHQQQLEKIIE